MNCLEFKRTETIKFKGIAKDILKVFTDGIGYIHLDEFLNIVSENNEDKKKEMRNKIPNTYIRKFDVCGKDELFLDRLAMFYVLVHIDDYDLFWRYASQIRNPKHYSEKLFLDIYPEITKKSKQWNSVNGRVSELNKLQQDLLHKLENDDLEDEQLFNLTKKLKEIRRERRKVKNELSNLQICKEINNNCNISNEEISKMKSIMSKSEYCLDNKIYNARANEELIHKYGCESILK